MSRFNTGNPLGSGDPRDLDDNAKDMDLAANSLDPTWTDRFQQIRLTYAGMQQQFSLAQDDREQQFSLAQDDREQRFNTFIASSGYHFAGDYAPGIEITEYNQVIRDENGEFWRVSGQVDLPYVTTGAGIPEGDALVPAGDAVLRQELSSQDGADRIGYEGGTVAGLLDQISPLRPASVSAHNSMWSWWAKPCFLRHKELRTHKSYLSITQNDGAMGLIVQDHMAGSQELTIITRDTLPDDHNTGSVVTGDGRVAVFLPTRVWAGRSNGAYIEFPSEGEPIITPHELGVGNDYPNAYNCDGELLVMARSSATNSQWSYRLNSWPLTDWYGPRGLLFEGTETRSYIATRRSPSDASKIMLAVGWHPTASPAASIYFGEIHRHGAASAWDFVANGSVIANLTTGENLPVSESDLELVYECPEGKTTRLFDVSDDAVLFMDWTIAVPSDAEYKIAIRVGGSWVVRSIAPAGEPFEGNNFYFGGAAIEEVGGRITATYATSAFGKWECVRVRSFDAGENWIRIDAWEASGGGGATTVAARPMAEQISEASYGEGVNDARTAAFTGRYNRNNYQDFFTSIQTLDSAFSPDSALGSSLSLASVGTDIQAKAGNRQGSVVLGSINATVEPETSWTGNIASSGSTNKRGVRTAIIASSNSTVENRLDSSSCGAALAAIGANVSGDYAAVIAARESESSGDGGVCLGTFRSKTIGGVSAVIAAHDSEIANSGVVMLASRSTKSDRTWCVVGGFASSGTPPSTANRKWQIRSDTGDIAISGALTEGVGFADIAKLMPNGEGAEIPPGTILTLIGGSLYRAREGERIDAIVAATPGIIQNDTPFHWQGRYLTDEWGRQIMEDVVWAAWPGYEGPLSDAPTPVPEGAEIYSISVPLENPEYDPASDNLPRSSRPDEWVIAGVHGVILTRVDGSVTQQLVEGAASDRRSLYIAASSIPGVGRLSGHETNVQVMSVEKEFDGDYGIALCLLR